MKGLIALFILLGSKAEFNTTYARQEDVGFKNNLFNNEHFALQKNNALEPVTINSNRQALGNYLNQIIIAQDDLINQKTISTGIGIDARSATKNAIENALKKLAGSVISSQTLMNKRTRIVNGIANTVRELKSEIQEYSQGSVKSVNIISTQLNNGIYYVTAEVTVRMEDFRLFIKKLAKAEKPIGYGLIGQMAVNRENKKLKS